MEVPSPEGEGRRAKVLVVEDEPLVRMLVADGLRDAGFVVIEAASAVEALAYVAGGGGTDVVFSDVRMPGGMSGLELAARVRANYPAIRIILTSGDIGPVNLGELGSFIAKPFPVRQAIELVRGVLGQT